MTITTAFKNYLYNYWLNNYDNICDYCKNKVECLGKDCDCYTEDATSYLKFFNRNRSCLDLDFGQCDKLRETPCADCNILNNFIWNGEVPVEDD